MVKSKPAMINMTTFVSDELPRFILEAIVHKPSNTVNRVAICSSHLFLILFGQVISTSRLSISKKALMYDLHSTSMIKSHAFPSYPYWLYTRPTLIFLLTTRTENNDNPVPCDILLAVQVPVSEAPVSGDFPFHHISLGPAAAAQPTVPYFSHNLSFRIPFAPI